MTDFARLAALMDEFHEDHDLLRETPDETAARHIAGLTDAAAVALAAEIQQALAIEGDDDTRRSVLRRQGVLWWSGDPGELTAWLSRVMRVARDRG